MTEFSFLGELLLLDLHSRQKKNNDYTFVLFIPLRELNANLTRNKHQCLYSLRCQVPD